MYFFKILFFIEYFMIGMIVKNMLTRGLSMKRWNNYPRIEDMCLLDNVGYTMHIAQFLAYLEEQNGNTVNREFLMKRIMFQSLKSLVLSDINSGTKTYILKNDPEIFSQLENKALNYILSLDAPEYLKQDMKNVMENTSFETELLIIESAKKIAWWKESEVNAKIFSDIYEIPLREIKKWLEESAQKLTSMKELLENEDYLKYLSHIRRLSYCMRWNQQSRIFPISVMSHLVLITFITYVLVMIENENGKNYDMWEMLLRAMYHDIPEAITWDIITPTKKAVPGFVELLEKVEIDMMNDYLFSYIPESYKNQVFPYMLHPFEGEVGKLVKYADILSALLEAKVEVNHGSENFKEIYRTIKKKVNTFEWKSIDYILKHMLDSFDAQSWEDIYLEKF